MFDQLEKLNEISRELTKAKSLLAFLGDYFKKDEPEPTLLMNRYKMYSDMYNVIFDIIIKQEKQAEEVTDEIYNIARALKGGGAA